MSRTDVVLRPGPDRSPVQWCEPLGRRMRLDPVETIGTSTQVLAEHALSAGEWEVAADLAEYFLDEMTRINDALFTWLTEIVVFAREHDGVPDHSGESARLIDGMRGFGPGDGDLDAVLRACAARDALTARARLETMAVRVASLHDQLVWWIQQLLANVADRHGEQAVCDVVLRTYENLWRPRYATWGHLTPLQRLQVSVEGMRGHLSGPRHRGDVGVQEEVDRYVMTLDPCGSCGVLRRGDPDSGRAGCEPAGTRERHAWARNQLGLGWYAVHSAIVMEWMQTRDGLAPMRPMQDCDTEAPCRWFIYKDLASARVQP